MSAKEMLEKVQELKERTILNGFAKPVEADEFWNEHWIQILDILDDALFNYLGGNRMSDLISRQDAIDEEASK